MGVGAVGIWDELFFICTVFALLAGTSPTGEADILQAIVFVLVPVGAGLPGVGSAADDPVRALQAYIFKRTRSLTYVVTVHLLFDAVVFLVLVHAHNPGMLDGFFLV